MLKGATNDTGLVIRDLAELALESETLDVFRWEALSRIARLVGADVCSMSSMTNPGVDLSATLIGGDAAPLIAHLRPFYGELHPDEIGRALQPTAQRDSDVLSARRRDRLSFYREYLSKVGRETYALRLWRTETGYACLTIGRTGRYDQRRFLARATATIDALFPVLALSERAHSRKCITACGRGSAHAAAFTAAEARVVALLERGLTNREIASLLGVSPNTVRNRVASAFRRVGASRRAELVYLLGTNSG